MIVLHVIWSVNLLMKILSFGTHVTGLYAIWFCECKTNQSKILFNIGIAELSIIVPKAIKIVLQISSYKGTQVNITNGEYDSFGRALQLPRIYFQLYDRKYSGILYQNFAAYDCCEISLLCCMFCTTSIRRNKFSCATPYSTQ